MMKFIKKYSIGLIAGLVVIAAGSVYLFDKLTDDDRVMTRVSSTGASQSSASTSASGTIISESDVKAIVEKELGKSDLTYVRIILDTDDGIQEYDVKATSGDTVYDLEIDAASGRVISSEQESVSRPSKGTGSSTSAEISEAEMKKIVEKASGKSNLTYTKIELEQDDDYQGRLIYDVTAYADGTEYEFDIDASSGEILSQSSEMGDD